MNRLTAVGYTALLISRLSTAWAEPAGAAPPKVDAPHTTVAQLMSQELVTNPAKEVALLTVTYAPGGSSPPHRHDAQVFVYVLEGTLTMQVQGHAAVTLHSGETFYESPDDIHVISANASQVAPAKFLVVMVKDKSRQASQPVIP